jgi:hypothetical protein
MKAEEPFQFLNKYLDRMIHQGVVLGCSMVGCTLAGLSIFYTFLVGFLLMFYFIIINKSFRDQIRDCFRERGNATKKLYKKVSKKYYLLGIMLPICGCMLSGIFGYNGWHLVILGYVVVVIGQIIRINRVLVPLLKELK